MKKSVTEILNQVEHNKRMEAERAAEITDLENALGELKKSREAAADAGDYDTYEKLGEEIRKTKDRIYVKIKSAKNVAVSPEDAVAAWKEEAAKLSKEFSKRLSDYETEREKLCTKFEGTLTAYNEILKTREKLADAVGVPVDSFVVQVSLPQDKAVFPGQFRDDRAEARFFFTTGVWKQQGSDPYTYMPNIPALGVMHSLLHLQKSVDKIDFGR